MPHEFSWGTFDDCFVTDLAEHVGGAKVLEVFAGNGLLAARLALKGTGITATSTFASHDGHCSGMFHDVSDMDARQAVRDLGSAHDILLMSWPPADESALHAALLWGEEKPIIFIGEVSQPDLGLGGLGGCASDLFFELTQETRQFSSYISGRSGLDRACIRTLVPDAVTRWRMHVEEMKAHLSKNF